MARFDLPTGVHRVKRLTKTGIKFHFYGWRGGPKFWEGTERHPTAPEFFAALAAAIETPKPSDYMTPQMVDDFLSSAEMPKGERTRQDYRLWALRFAQAFKDDPARLFEEPESRGEVNEWRKQWAHSPRQYDYAGTVVTRILNWAWKDAGKLRAHYCGDFRKVYEADRAEIVWTPDHREKVYAVAPPWVSRILTAGCETGLRPADLVTLSRGQIEATSTGRRIRIRTNKRKRTAYIPVTPTMSALLDATADGQFLILTNPKGTPLAARAASDALRYWRNKAGLTPEALGYDLRLQDTRGTAATRLLNSGLSLGEIASFMGWSVRYAAAVIEHYARVSPDESDAILVKLAQAKGGAS
ncbi:tyrosine-type recombinase/integrase [Pararhodobacter zhoushanensis]|uniref:Site-specific integrase n=1 Tax=Pararhodobacter zhoushanensis TaxID=2479545 RepID=A0ABT3GW04_9RHOB|nr:site-specific integrase [Pararhodobacter zhoushanensis]MCW1931729.1 site-specific integrase [Pararhodobacter zhoushanensis]